MGHAKPGNSLEGTHCEIVSSLSGKQQIFEKLCQRMINFHYACICSYNLAIKSIAEDIVSNIGAQPPHGRNLRFLCGKYDLTFKNFCEAGERGKATSLLRRRNTPDGTKFDNDFFADLLELLMIRHGFLPLAGTTLQQ